MAKLHSVAVGRQPETVNLEPLASTMGALGDVLASNNGIIARAPLPERARLRLNVQATLHWLAQWSVQQPGVPASRRTVLLELLQATETAALMPAGARTSALECLSLASDNTLGGAIARWSLVAEQELAGTNQLTSYTFQSTAGMIAMLCGRTAEAARAVRPREAADRTPEVLQRSFAAWRDAAAWPDHVRLGAGASTGLRRATGVLMAALDGPMSAGLHPVARLLLLQDGIHRGESLAGPTGRR